MPVFLIGRSLQGFGGGMLLAFAYAMIRLVFAESLWPRAIAIVSGMWGAATLVGPAIGGTFAELGIWRAAFWALVPLCLLFAALAAAVLPKPPADRSPQPPLPAIQLVSLVAAVISLSATGIATERSWILAGIAAAAVFLAVLVRVDRQSRSRLFPSGAFLLAGPLFALYATTSLLEGSVAPSEIFAPLFLQVLHGQTPLLAGYLAALLGGGWTIGSFLSSGANGRTVSRYIAACPVVALAGMLGLAVLLPRSSDGGWPALAPLSAGLTAIGLGIGIGWPHLLTRVLKSVRPDEQDLASASLTTMQLLATAIGSALAGMIANFAGLADPGGPIGISHAAFWLYAGFSLMPALAILTVRRSLLAQPGAGDRN
jgi:predicted MFS family arabinose efflux permease